MIKNVSKMAAVAAWLAALPGVAHAGSASAKGSFVFSVVTQCSLKGNDVDLGGFWTTQTWGDVADVVGGETLGVAGISTDTLAYSLTF